MKRSRDSKSNDNEVTKGSFFLKKLYTMLSDADRFGIGSDIITWSKEGDAFVIFDPVEFARQILPKYFHTDKFSSFQRQLNAYDFKRNYLHSFKNPKSLKNNIHVYQHGVFHRDCPDLLEKITRKVKLKPKEREGLQQCPKTTVDTKNAFHNPIETEELDDKSRGAEVTKGSFFPKKLYAMLSDADCFGIGSDIITWSKEGDAFVIFDPVEFARQILPKYFQTDKFSSFQRQLNAYDFKRTHLQSFRNPQLLGNNVHVYKHGAFHRDCPDLLEKITRKVKLKAKEKEKEKKSLPQSSKTLVETKNTFNIHIETEKFNCVEGNNCLPQHGSAISAAAAFSEDDFHLQLPRICGLTYSLSDWDVEKESLKSNSKSSDSDS